MNANFVVAAGSTVTGLSGVELNNATEATTNTLDLHIVGFVNRAGNDVGEHAKWLVRINRTELISLVPPGEQKAPTGELLWVAEEAMLDAVTAISGSGPAYVYYFIETMTQAGVQMGLGAKQAERLAISTFVGASSMAQTAGEAPSVLRQRVTSKGGTTHAAISSMEADGLPEILIRALLAARQRAADIGREFGAAP